VARARVLGCPALFGIVAGQSAVGSILPQDSDLPPSLPFLEKEKSFAAHQTNMEVYVYTLQYCPIRMAWLCKHYYFGCTDNYISFVQIPFSDLTPARLANQEHDEGPMIIFLLSTTRL
jgi:hypothetical protein